MATIDLITYDQKMVTPKDDALIHQFGISNGVLYGCDVTLSDSNTLHITGGQGVIYGRQWEITEGDITVTLPASGSLKGRLYVKIDLSNTTNPIELLVQTDVTLPDLTDDDQINVNNSVSELELYTFDVSSLTISNLVKTVETVADGDHADVVQMQNDISQLNSSLATKSYIKTSTYATAITKDGHFNLSDMQSDWANSKAIIFSFRRYGNMGNVIVPTGTILAGLASNAVYFYYGSAINYIGISTTGVVTMKSNIQDAVFTDIVFIY